MSCATPAQPRCRSVLKSSGLNWCCQSLTTGAVLSLLRPRRARTGWPAFASACGSLAAIVRSQASPGAAQKLNFTCPRTECNMLKIGIVEDNKTTRDGLKTIVDLSPGYRCVCVCETAEDALRLLPKHQPDVVLMDIQLPNMSGVECVAQLKERLPSVQVIMVTVYQDPDRIFRALRAGASGYLLKRATPEQVLNAIRDVQQGGVPMSAEIARKVLAHFQAQTAAT